MSQQLHGPLKCGCVGWSTTRLEAVACLKATQQLIIQVISCNIHREVVVLGLAQTPFRKFDFDVLLYDKNVPRVMTALIGTKKSFTINILCVRANTSRLMQPRAPLQEPAQPAERAKGLHSAHHSLDGHIWRPPTAHKSGGGRAPADAREKVGHPSNHL